MGKSLLQDEKWLPVIGYENISKRLKKQLQKRRCSLVAKSLLQDEKVCYITGSTQNLHCHH